MPRFHFLALVPLFAQPKLKIPFLCLSLLRNQTETLAIQDIQASAHTCTVYDICQQTSTNTFSLTANSFSLFNAKNTL